jgi:hypothetical protein
MSATLGVSGSFWHRPMTVRTSSGGGVLDEIGIHPLRHLDEQVCHHDHPTPEGSCG